MQSIIQLGSQIRENKIKMRILMQANTLSGVIRSGRFCSYFYSQCIASTENEYLYHVTLQSSKDNVMWTNRGGRFLLVLSLVLYNENKLELLSTISQLCNLYNHQLKFTHRLLWYRMNRITAAEVVASVHEILIKFSSKTSKQISAYVVCYLLHQWS